jgi:hypothetical protein
MKDRTVLIGLLCVGTLCAGALQAQEADGPKGKPGRPDRGPRPIMGGITNRFAAIDTNTNGVISLDEFKAMHAKREEMKKQRGDKYDAATAATKPSAEETFKKLDTDGDGTLTKKELAADRMPRGNRRPPRGEGGQKPEAPEAPAAVTP